MSASSNWNNPDMYYPQDRSKSSVPGAYGPVDPYSGAPLDGSSSDYGSVGVYGSNGYGAATTGASTYGAQQVYGGQGSLGAPNYYLSAGPRTNTLAIIALVASCVSITGIFLGGIAGVVMGHIAIKQIRVSGEAGLGLAKAALWVGYILSGLWILFWIAYFIFMFVMFGSILFIGGVH